MGTAWNLWNLSDSLYAGWLCPETADHHDDSVCGGVFLSISSRSDNPDERCGVLWMRGTVPASGKPGQCRKAPYVGSGIRTLIGAVIPKGEMESFFSNPIVWQGRIADFFTRTAIGGVTDGRMGTVDEMKESGEVQLEVTLSGRRRVPFISRDISERTTARIAG